MNKRKLEKIKKDGTLNEYHEALKEYWAEERLLTQDKKKNTLKELRHYKDTTTGLYATDKIPNDLFRIIFADMVEDLGYDGEKIFSASDYEYYENWFKKGIEKLMFQI